MCSAQGRQDKAGYGTHDTPLLGRASNHLLHDNIRYTTRLHVTFLMIKILFLHLYSFDRDALMIGLLSGMKEKFVMMRTS